MVPPKLTLVSNTLEEAVATGPENSTAAQSAASERAAEHAVAALSTADRREKLRVIEALLFASAEPLSTSELAKHLPEGEHVESLLGDLQAMYDGRGVCLAKVAGRWMFRTADDLSYVLERQVVDQRRLSKAALETLAIVAYHQPVTRAEIEEIRGVTTSAGTLDALMETGWIRPRGRRRAPGRPITYGTTQGFLEHFGFEAIKDLPGLAELKGSGLLDANLPPGFSVPEPKDVAALMPDELPLEDTGEDEAEAEGESTDESSADAIDDMQELPLQDEDEPAKPEPSAE